MEEKDKIGLIFKNTFNGHEILPAMDEWATISNTMEKVNFYKFNPFRFNVFYAGTIGFCFMFCVGTGINFALNQIKNNPRISSNKEIILNKAFIDSTVKTLVKKEVHSPKTERLQNEPIYADKSGRLLPANSKEENNYIDTILESDTDKLMFRPDSIDDNKRILYITKQDTIYKYDTLRPQKQKKRWF